MLAKGLSQEALGKECGVSHASVSGWLSGAMPRQAKLKRLADFLGVSVAELLDDSRDLPDSRIAEEQTRYLAEAPIKTAAKMADAITGTQSERQKAFIEYLAFLHSVRAAAEAFAPNDPAEARRRFDRSLATWLTDRERHTNTP